MRLQRILFYVLLIIFVAAVVVVCVVDASTAWSRIGTGLITGSFIGMIGALVNYIHQRREYWEKFAELCWKVASSLQRYRREATRYNEILHTSSIDEIITKAQKNVDDNYDQIQEMEENCKRLSLQCQDDLYVPLFFWNPSYGYFQKLCDKIIDDFGFLYVEREMCRTFDLIDMSKPKEEMDIVIGDPDEFFEETFRHCIEYQEIIEYDCHQFSELIHKVLAHGFDKTLTKLTRKMLDISATLVVSGIENIKVKDVRRLRADDTMEDSWEEERA